MGTKTFRFVVQQQIPNTHTYRVISPSRNNFAAVNIVNRDDVWKAVGADVLQEKVETQNRAAAQKAKQEAQAKADKQAELDKQAADRAQAAEDLKNQEATKQQEQRTDPFAGKRVTVDENGNVPAELAPNDPRRFPNSGVRLVNPGDEMTLEVAKYTDVNTNLPKGSKDAEEYFEQQGYRQLQIGDPKSKETALAAAAQGVPVYTKPEVQVEKFDDLVIGALGIAARRYGEFGVPLAITSGNEINQYHTAGTAHARGQKFDLKTKNIGLTLSERQQLARNIQSDLAQNMWYDYSVTLEYPGEEREHIDVAFKGYTPEYSRINREQYRKSVEPNNESWWNVGRFFK